MADRILVIRLGALGDVTRTLPSLVALRAQYPGAHICWLVERKASGVLEDHPLIDETLVFPREELVESARGLRPLVFLRTLLSFVRALRARRFDLVLDFHAILKSGVLSRLSGAPVRASYARPVAKEGAWRFANRRAELSRKKISRYERNASLLRFLAIDPAGNGTPPLPLSDASLAKAELALDPRYEWVAIHPGTSAETSYKRYTVDGYAQLARALSASRGARCIVTCGPGSEERAFADAIVAASLGSADLAPQTRRVADLAVLLSRCKLFVGSDSGPLHVASLVGTPVVQILGPTDPTENAPLEGAAYRSVRVPLACSPCRRGCEAATCMQLIPPERVVSAAVELLAERAEPERRPRPAISSSAFLSAPGP